MKKKLFSVLLALVLALSLSLVTAVPVAATTIIHVPGDHGTIQEAINAASEGDIILVTGTYMEDLVIPAGKNNLELVGATGATIKGVETFGGEFPDGIPNMEILSSGVKIHGFTIEGPDAVPGRYSMGMYIGATNVEIYDNAFLTHTQNFEQGDQYSVVIQTYREVIFEGVDISGLNIHHNTFDSLGETATTTVGYDGIFVNLDAGEGFVTIVGNTFDGNLFRAISVERSNVVIGDNIIETALAPRVSETVGGYQGMFIGCFDIGGGVYPPQSDVSITGNTVKGATTSEGFAQGIRVGHTLQSSLTNITVSRNTVQYNDEGITVRADASGVAVSYNNITGNTVGVQNDDTGVTLDATYNWWGTTVEGEIMAMVSGDVDYSLWLGGLYSSSTVTMNAIYTAPAIGISVDPLSVNFFEVVPGTPAPGDSPVTVTNTGTVAVNLDATIINESHSGVYTTGLTIAGSTVDAWIGAAAVGGGTEPQALILTVPSGTAPGMYTATLVFWAEAQ